jgi:multidrug efflux pump subunit AcrB
LFSKFFIDRPIFASVLSIMVTLAGAVSLSSLPVAQYPDITPPTVEVAAVYPGANAQVVADTVAAPIEQQVNGVEGMLYMSSQCANDGSYSLTVTFQHGVDLNMAQVLVQNRVNLAQPVLPELVKRRGVAVKKKSPSVLMIVNLFSPDKSRDSLYLSNYATIQLKDELSRLEGVGDISFLGQRDYSMRLWLDPPKMAMRQLTASDVVRAIEQQNTQVAAGQLGQPPVATGQVFQFTLSTMGRLTDPEQFADMIIKADARGRIVRLSDVANIELGAQAYDQSATLNGRPSVALSVYQLPGSNALEVAKRVRAKVREMRGRFPDGIDYSIVYDTTPFINQSIQEVFKTLRDAVILVAVVVLLFLQNWRSAIIPLVAVPVAIVGTFAVMALLGFSLNNLTLFGLVLAIGIVVDDAIVVVEAVEHHIEHGKSPREATLEAMRQVSGPVIAVGLVLSAVFVPCAFIAGITGQFFRQFALTIAVSTVISAFNSLTLSPALTALLLRPRDKGQGPPLPRLVFALAGGWLGWEFLGPRLAPWTGSLALPVWATAAGPWLAPATGALVGAVLGWLVGRPVNRVLGSFFRRFNAGFGHATNFYTRAVGGLLRVSAVALLVYGGLLAVTYWGFQRTPRGFIPSQDMGYLMVNVQLPDSASTERTDQVMRRIESIALATPGVKHATGIAGQSFVLNAAGANFGSLFVNLKDYPLRRDPGLDSDSIANRLRAEFGRQITDANVAVFGPPPVRGVGRAGGFALMVEDRGDFGPAELQRQTENLVGKAAGLPGLVGVFSVFRANVPQLHLEPDAGACMMRGVQMQDFADTVGAYEGSLYVNDFNRFGRTWQVMVQAEAEARDQPEDLYPLRMRNARGRMVPVGSLAGLRDVNGPLVLTRYNMYPAASVNGTAGPGLSSGQVIDTLRGLANQELPQSMAYEWTDMSYLELLAGSTAMVIFAFAVVMVFLVLAAQYESWSLPLAVILVVPLCLLSAIVGVNLAHMDINIFTQIGFVVLVGLASKNAILIVEFAKVQRHEGRPRREATLAACRLRLRPIVMTSLAFVLGVLPLILSRGAGAEMRRALGTAVFSGMIGVTLFGIALTPVFFFTIDRLSETRLFASPLVRAFGSLGLGLLTLRPVREVGTRLLRRDPPERRPARPARQRPVPPQFVEQK